MANYVCCGKTCCQAREEETHNELHSETKQKPIVILEHQKPVMVSYASNMSDSLCRIQYQNGIKRAAPNEATPQNVKAVLTDNNSYSSDLLKSKGKAANKRVQSSFHNTNANSNNDNQLIGTLSPTSKYTKQFTLTNPNQMNAFNTFSSYEEKDMKIKLAETKIVKRSNLGEYNKNVIYGKPSNIYTSERLNLFQTAKIDDSSQSKRTFRKFNENAQSTNGDLYSCEQCRDLYKALIIHHEELKPIWCPNCGNILNEKSYQYCYRLYNALSPEKRSSQGGNLDHGRMTENWNKWIQVRTEQKKENMAYDIISGRTPLTQSNSSDAQLKKLITSTREKLDRSSRRQPK